MFAFKAVKVQKQMREQTINILNGGERIRYVATLKTKLATPLASEIYEIG